MTNSYILLGGRRDGCCFCLKKKQKRHRMTRGYCDSRACTKNTFIVHDALAIRCICAVPCHSSSSSSTGRLHSSCQHWLFFDGADRGDCKHVTLCCLGTVELRWQSLGRRVTWFNFAHYMISAPWLTAVSHKFALHSPAASSFQNTTGTVAYIILVSRTSFFNTTEHATAFHFYATPPLCYSIYLFCWRDGIVRAIAPNYYIIH